MSETGDRVYMALRPCVREGKTDLIHMRLFHGVLDPEVNDSGKYTNSFFEAINSEPLSITKSGRLFPAIIIPGASLVVTEEVKDVLERFDVLSKKVTFNKLVDSWYDIGDMSFYVERAGKANAFGDWTGEYLNSLPNIPEYHDACPPYYEALGYRIKDINALPITPDIREISFRFPDRVFGTQKFDIRYNKNALDVYPIIWHLCVLIPIEIYLKIEKFFDFRFFSKIEVRL